MSNTEVADSRMGWVYKISGAAALITGILFLVAMISLIVVVPFAGGLVLHHRDFVWDVALKQIFNSRSIKGKYNE